MEQCSFIGNIGIIHPQLLLGSSLLIYSSLFIIDLSLPFYIPQSKNLSFDCTASSPHSRLHLTPYIKRSNKVYVETR